MKMLNIGLISIIDFGCIAYESSSGTHGFFSKKLDVIQSTAISLGAMKTSSISILPEMGKIPLE